MELISKDRIPKKHSKIEVREMEVLRRKDPFRRRGLSGFIRVVRGFSTTGKSSNKDIVFEKELTKKLYGHSISCGV